MASFPGAAADLSDEFVLRKCSYFTTVHLWPLKKELNPQLWLQNFEEHERRHARYLLNSFIYLEDHVVEQVAFATFQSLSSLVAGEFGDPNGVRARWGRFLDSVLIVPVTGETPGPTDSGYSFARLARDKLGISNSRIVEAPAAMAILLGAPSTPVVFLDDFVGTGNQFRDTWNRSHSVAGVGSRRSFGQLARDGVGAYYYCPTVATEYGVGNLAKQCPELHVVPGHNLSPRYSAFHPESMTWPDDLRAGASDFIRDVSQRAGIPDRRGAEDDWRGFHELGLSLAFAHGVPDATLPIFWWESEKWNPLKLRRQSN